MSRSRSFATAHSAGGDWRSHRRTLGKWRESMFICSLFAGNVIENVVQRGYCGCGGHEERVKA